MDGDKRRRVPLVLYCICTAYVLEVLTLIYNTVLTARNRSRGQDCYDLNPGSWPGSYNPNTIGLWLIVSTWVVLFVLFLLGVLMYNVYPDQNMDSWMNR